MRCRQARVRLTKSTRCARAASLSRCSPVLNGLFGMVLIAVQRAKRLLLGLDVRGLVDVGGLGWDAVARVGRICVWLVDVRWSCHDVVVFETREKLKRFRLVCKVRTVVNVSARIYFRRRIRFSWCTKLGHTPPPKTFRRTLARPLAVGLHHADTQELFSRQPRGTRASCRWRRSPGKGKDGTDTRDARDQLRSALASEK